jgi:hypothetical protein
MIVDEKIDRFATNWGVIPTSIDLAPNYTTHLDAMSVELAGPEFSRESDFGDGLTGLGSLGFAAPTPAAAIEPSATSTFDPSTLIPDFANWDWHEWLIAIGGGYTLYQIFFGPKAQARREGYAKAKEGYHRQRSKVKEDTALSFF